MEVIHLTQYTTGSFLNSSQPQQEQPCYKFHIILPTSEPEIFVRLEKNGKGGGRRASFHKIREIYVDGENRIHAGFKPVDKEDQSYQYAVIGKLEVIGDGLS